MKRFLDDDFLLRSDTAVSLYHDVAAKLPIVDFHCHLPVGEIAADRQFENLTKIWLDGDHYKWRAMRAAGVDESLITGAAADRDKFNAWAGVVPQCIGNPLYHWTHMEMRRPFGITDRLLGPATADSVWSECNALLAQADFSTRGILRRMRVAMVATTDDPIDDLSRHAELATDAGFDTIVLPTWRPDNVFKIERSGFGDYIKQLATAANVDIRSFEDLLQALRHRLDYFARHGCCAADHGVDTIRYRDVPADADFSDILAMRLRGEMPTVNEIALFDTAVQQFLGREYARRNWAMQLHIGAQRDNNTRMRLATGPDTGFDSIGDRPIAASLARFLDALARDDELPRTVLYCLNPAHNEVIATMTGNFQGDIPGKVQFGSAWWFNDQKDGMIRQLTCLAQMSLLPRFVGMVTDSRSFLSYVRHEYFRRILCDLLGGWVEAGEVPADNELLANIVTDICGRNAAAYFSLPGLFSAAD